jgi:mRNA degradation ribonuclease J1/J2
VKRAIENANGQLIQSHISGHLLQDDIIALIKQSKPHAIVPIHTFGPQLLSDQFTNVRLLVDGESFDTF